MQLLAIVIVLLGCIGNDAAKLPLVVSTWTQSYFPNATEKAWEFIKATNGEKRLGALVEGLSTCEDLQCDHTVGFGGSPDEHGETTLDALVMDGNKRLMGAVGALRGIKAAARVAWAVMNFTEHSLLVGDQATNFAVQMGFNKTNLTTAESIEMYQNWTRDKCQPNFWQNVHPDPKTQCGPYNNTMPIPNVTIDKKAKQKDAFKKRDKQSVFNPSNHDTLGMIIIDVNGEIAAGTTTNGASHKIPGRVGDSPIPGAGAYADEFGAAAETGDGDVMMRFLPSYLTVEKMRDGCTPNQAAQIAILRVAQSFPNYMGAIVAANKYGDYGAACNWIPDMHTFSYCVASPDLQNVTIVTVECVNASMVPPKCQTSNATGLVPYVFAYISVFVVILFIKFY